MQALRYLIIAVIGLAISPSLAFVESKPLVPLYPIYDNNRWGLIDPSGKVVLEPRFEKVAKYPPWNFAQLPQQAAAALEISVGAPVRDSVIPVRFDGKSGFATRVGEVLALGKYDETDSEFHEGRVFVKSGGRYGFADERGELVVPAQFDEAYPFRSGSAVVRVGKKWGIIDRAGKSVVSPTWDDVDSPSAFYSDWIKVRVGNRSGIVDRTGKEILPVRFERIANPSPPLVSVVDSGRVVYVRPGGEVAFELKCPKGFFRAPKGMGFPFIGRNFALVSCGDMTKYGLIDTQGKFLLDPTWDSIGPFSDGRSLVSKGGRVGMIDEEGRIVLELGKFKLCGISEGRVCFVDPKTLKVGFLDRDGQVVVPASFDWVLRFEEGLCVARTDEKRPFGHGYIDPKGSWVIAPSYWRANSFKGPLAVVEQPVAKDTLELSYIDKSGKTVYKMRFKGYAFQFFQ